MEIELKYLAQKETADSIFRDLKDNLSNEKTFHMLAVYYDTPDRALRKSHIAVRVRKENECTVATCKWGGGSHDGLHEREEININLPIKDIPASINREVFYGTAAYDVIGIDESLEKFIEMDYYRKEFHLTTDESVSALSYDEGFIRGKEKNIPISEIEIELLEGKVENIVSIGRKLEEKYEIDACNISKLARGLAINNEK